VRWGEGEVERHPFLDLVVPLGGAGDHVRHPVHLRLGEEADMAEVDAHQRGAAAADQLGGPQDGAVTAEDDGQLDLPAVDLLLTDRGHRVPAQLGGDQLGGVRRRRPAGVGEHQHAAGHRRTWGADRAGPAAIASVIIWSSSSSLGVASRCRCTKYSTLPLGPGSGLATTARSPRPSPVAAAATVRTASACRATSRTTPPAPRRSLPTSNCGLTISSRSASSAAAATSAGSTRVREMKDGSPTTSSGAGATDAGSRVRTLVRSSTVTRWSVCSDQESCP